MTNRQQDMPLSENQLFKELLSKIKPINYREINGIKEGENINFKHLLVITIDHLLEVTTELNWGLCVQNDFVYVYNGQFWKPINSADFKSFLGEAAHYMGVGLENARFYQFRDQLFKQFIAVANLPAPNRPKDTVLINLKNGTFEITPNGANLREFRKEDFLTYQLDFEYSEDSTAPVFKKYLSTVLPDEGLQLLLSEFIGYVFTKHLKLEKCLLLYGDGANGKSVFFEIINALLGKENVSNFSLGNLNEEHNRALIANKLLNYGSEIKSGIQTDIFKQLVSGESIQARLKYQNSVTIDDYARLCFNCNELPTGVEHTDGYFRRFLIIPFNIRIPDNEQDPMLAKKIIGSELSGVFNWVLNGVYSVFKNNKFSENEIVAKILKEYREESDSVVAFINDTGFVPSNTSSELFSNTMKWYKDFCNDNNLRPLGMNKFSKRIKRLGFKIERMNQGGKTHILMEVKK
jgi:putative DNA primase/helicase